MIVKHRLRRLLPFLATAALAMALVACAATGKYPNTTFEPKSELGRAIDFLWDRMLLLGTIVFILTEAALLFVVWKYRHRGQQEQPRQIHGNTQIEILWTLIPAVVLVFIAVPTVRTIFETQGAAPGNALKVEVIGHQWWWEFRYPQYNIVTANELYLPTGQTVSFDLKTADVIHSFWIPQLGAKRDLISNRTNYVWFTTDQTATGVWNGFCMEYCGASHANMHFRVFTVEPTVFASWVARQQSNAAFGAIPAVAQADTVGADTGARAPVTPGQPRVPGAMATEAATTTQTPTAPGQQQAGPEQRIQALDTGPAAPVGAPTQRAEAPAGGAPMLAADDIFPAGRLPSHAIPNSPLPNVAFQDNLVGDPARGQQVFSSSACIGCHAVRGNPSAVGVLGPDLTHFGSRYTLAAGMYPNDTRHLVRWIKNAPRMKPGSTMPALGRGEYDLRMKMTVTAGGLEDQQIADIAAYLQALK